MGNHFCQPKNILKNSYRIPPTYKSIQKKNIKTYNYEKQLKRIFDKIYLTYLRKSYSDDFTARTLTKRAISLNDSEEIRTKIVKLEEPVFFTDCYSMEDLEEFLSSCSNGDSIGYNSDIDEEIPISLFDKVLNGNKKIVDTLRDDELEHLLKEDKIHLTLAEKSEHNGTLIALLKKATQNCIISKIIDLTDDRGNSAVSIAALNHNIQAVNYILFKCIAKIPLRIVEKCGQTPFLMYFAKYGKIYKRNKEFDYILLLLLKKIIELYPEGYLLEHLNEIDEKTQLTLPNYLVNIYNSSNDLKDQIEECLRICIEKYPECAETHCRNHYVPAYKSNLYANIFANPDMEPEVCQKLVNSRKNQFAKSDKVFLRNLIKVHQDKNQKRKLKKIID